MPQWILRYTNRTATRRVRGAAIFPEPSSRTAAVFRQTTPRIPNSGNKIPSQFIDPGAAALAKIWPKANANPATTPGGYNYYQPIPNMNNGWIYRVRVDYQLGPNTKIYGSYQQAYDSQLAQGNGAHLYWTPGNAIPYPGGGESEAFRGKTLAGHFVHNFNATTTNDFMAAWAFGSFPFVQPNPSAASRSTLGYSTGKVFQTASLNIPAYSGAVTSASRISRRLLSLTTLRANMRSRRKLLSSAIR